MKFDFVSDTYTSGNYLNLEFDIAKVSLSLKNGFYNLWNDTFY